MQGQLLRVLFGDLDAYPKLRREVIDSLTHAWCRRVVLHVVAGERNQQLLAEHGAELILLESDDESIAPPHLGPWYNKVYLIHRAMEKHQEILFLDFDCLPVRAPDDRMWQILRTKDGHPRGPFQAANVGYVRPLYRRHGAHPVRRCLNTCAVYCADRTWLDQWLSIHESIRDDEPDLARLTEEVTLMHLLFKKHPLLDGRTMVNEYEIPVVRLRRSVPRAAESKRPEEIYFRHR